MDNVLTLIADPGNADLNDGSVSSVRGALAALGAETAPADWLARSVACDIPFGHLDIDQAAAAARQALGDLPVDIITQVAGQRRKRMLVADMESTIIRQEMLDELAELVGLKEKIADITWRAMNGEIDFKDALRARVALLKGLPATALEETAGRMELTDGAEVLVRTMRANGAHCVLVSGGFRFFTRMIRDRVGFDEEVGNDLEIEDGILTGNALEPILDKDAKVSTLLRFAGSLRVPVAETLAVGDGANDVPMLKAAGLGIAFHAKPMVSAEARARVEHGDLTALLYAQGYRAEEFVS